MDADSRDLATTRKPAKAEAAVEIALNERSRELLEILGDRFKGDAQVLYEGGIRILADTSNPARLPLAASAVREIMDDLEREAGFAHPPPDWKERIAKLEMAWQVAERSLDAGEGDGDGFAKTLEEFFTAFNRVPTRRSLADRAICAFDPAASMPPPAVRDARADTWSKLRRYFNRTLHREIRPTDAEFRRAFEAFETFLVDWLRPPTSADLDAIDDVLRKGPPDE
jgi:hypothetical protein